VRLVIHTVFLLLVDFKLNGTELNKMSACSKAIYRRSCGGNELPYYKPKISAIHFKFVSLASSRKINRANEKNSP